MTTRILYHRWCISVNRERNILKISQSAKWQTREAKGALETVMRQCELWVDETEYESKAEAALPQRGV